MAIKPDVKATQTKASSLTLTEKQITVLIIAAIVVLALSVRLYGLMDAGLTWDEPITINAGVSYVVALTHFEFNNGAWAVNYEHPPIGKYIYGIAIWIFNGSSTDHNGYVLARLMSVAMGVATCLLTYLIGREFFNREIGAISALTLAFIPVFVAHTQIAALDSPIAFLFTLTMCLFMLATKKNSALYYGLSAISLGLLIGVKLNGLLIIPVLAIFYLLQRHEYLANYKLKNANLRKVKGKKAVEKEENQSLQLIKAYLPPVALAGFCVITILTIFLLWPWLWFGTIDRLSMTLSHWTYSPQEYFLGALTQVPLYYYVVYFLVTTPLLLFIPLALGAYKVARSKDVYKYAILLWLIVPFAYSLSNFKQGGMRYLLMIYPAMALLCGCGLYEVAAWAGTLNIAPAIKKAALPVLCAITIVYLIICLASVQPYYLDYYNSLGGGYQKIHDDRTLNFGWWGEGIYGAEKYVSDIGGSNATAVVVTIPSDPTYRMFDLKPQYIQVGTANSTALAYTKKMLQPSTRESDNYYWNTNNHTMKPDYVITNYNAEEYYNVTVDPAYFKEVYSVNLQGASLAKVYKVL
jgi:4-amino-4-deoxy-L-arabinose transferase-like glycosyltransferase